MKILNVCISLALFLLLTGTAQAQQSNFSKLVVFGDSLSDTGNLAIVDLPPPYFQNRISDGPVIADLIADAIGSNAQASGHLLRRPGGFNYAVAGGNIVGDDREDLAQQIDVYLERVSNQADPNALYLVFVGGNDLRGIRSLASSTQASLAIDETIDVLNSQLERLRDAGARAFLIPNVANIARVPETLKREVNDPGIVARAEAYTREYNRLLSQALRTLSDDKGVSINVFDLFQSFENLLNNASDFGFTNIEEGCFDPDGFDVELECVVFGFGRRVFFDNIHPSSASNRIVAQQIILALPMLPSNERSRTVIAPILELLL